MRNIASNFSHFELGGPDEYQDPTNSVGVVNTTCILSSTNLEDVLKEYFQMDNPKEYFIDEWRIIKGLPMPVRELDMELGQWIYSVDEEWLRDRSRSLKHFCEEGVKTNM